MSGSLEELKAFTPSKEFFVGIDSDGCVFDTMEIKHKECFCPQFINHLGLQAVSRYAREAWEFANLYSVTRGANRFKALVRALDLLADRAEVKARRVSIPHMQSLRDWIRRETRLGEPALAAELADRPDPELARILEWSREVNAVVATIVHDVPPFPMVRESLLALREHADLMVVSQTPAQALEREWKEHDLDSLVRFIAGQELGTKTEHLAFATRNRYPSEKVLLVGDAPGDFSAARENNALFYPIVPGAEDASWARFHDEAMAKFFAGSYAGSYETSLIKEFNRHLPEKPTWQTGAMNPNG